MAEIAQAGTRSVQVRLEPKHVEMLDKMARRRGVDRSALLRRLIERANEGDRRFEVTPRPKKGA